MPLYRAEFENLLVRMRLMRNEFNETGFPGTAKAIAQAIENLDTAAKTYLQELAAKQRQKQQNP